MFRISKIIDKLLNRKNICEDVSDATFDEQFCKYSLLIGLEGYRSYSKSAKLLGISQTNLRTIIHRHKSTIGDVLSVVVDDRRINMLSLRQIKDISKILNIHVAL